MNLHIQNRIAIVALVASLSTFTTSMTILTGEDLTLVFYSSLVIAWALLKITLHEGGAT